MTAYSMESHNHADVVTGIAAKIAEGTNVSPLDLQALSDAAFSHKADIPLLDRPYLQHDHVERPGTCKLVRYIGMVQDMLDTEYYLSELQGKPTHYRDLCHYNGGEQDSDDLLSSDLAGRLAERTPLVIVPIPFGSEWFLEKLQQERRPTNQNQDEDESSTMTPCVETTTTNVRSTKKRDRDMDTPSAEPLSKPRIDGDDDDNDKPCVISNDDSMECEGTGGSTEQNQQESSDTTTTTTSSDWWPAGCMGSHTEHCPVLAKLYYDCNPKNTQRRLRLNDLVELIGVVSVDPLEADFSNQQQGQGKAVDDDLFLQDAFRDRLVLPPPSQLPRLHVLTYNLMDLDQVTKRVVGGSDLGQQDEQPSISMLQDDSMEHCRMQATRMLSEALLHDNVVSEATLMALLSMAQRTLSPQTQDDDMPPCWECVSTPTEETTLGCASLNIQVSSASSCLALYKQLQSVLEDICPIVALIDLTREALNNNTDLTAPRKDSQGRMLASPLQLPKGSTVLIHMGNMTEGALSPSGQETVCALQTLVTSHKVPYTFDALMKYPFEADYRVIVVSSVSSKGRATKPLKKSKLLPCALKVSMDVPASSSNLEERGLSSFNRDRLRRYLANSRCAMKMDDPQKRTRTLPGGANNVALSKQVLERAQNDFIQRRVATRGSDDLVTEEDFHRWLILTRLQGRSRNDGEQRGATTQDWERSLKLDDAMKLSYS